MPTFTFFQRAILLVASYFTFASATAQGVQYANQVVGTADYTDNATQGADRNVDTYSTLQPQTVGILVRDARERVEFASDIKPGTGQSGMYVQINKLLNPILGNTLDASVFNSSAITAYYNGQQVGSWSLGSLIRANVMKEGQRTTLILSPAPSSTFNQLELNLDGAVNGYSANLFEAFGPAPAPLPVQLVGFQARPTATGGVQLNWNTASELNNQHFIVERASQDQAGEFVALGRVAGAGTTSQARSYQFVDATPGTANYYRLRQVDIDGRATYSATVAVNLAPAKLAAYPSPATSHLTVAVATATQLSIFNQQGKLVQQTALAAGTQSVDISLLPTGLYYLHEASTGQRLRIEKTGF